MLFLPESAFLLVVLLLLLVVEVAVDGVVVVRLPVLVVELMRLPLHLAPHLLLVVVVVNVGNDVVVLLVVLQQLLLPLHRQTQLTVLQEVLRDLLVVYHVVGVADRAEPARWQVLDVRVVRFETDDVEVLLVLEGLLLHGE
jgi:hypothetical protein